MSIPSILLYILIHIRPQRQLQQQQQQQKKASITIVPQ